MDFFSLKRNEMCKKLSSNEVSFLPRKDSPDERFNIISDLSGANSSKPFRRSFKQRQDCGHAIRLHQSVCCFYLHGANQASKFYPNPQCHQSHQKRFVVLLPEVPLQLAPSFDAFVINSLEVEKSIINDLKNNKFAGSSF